MNTVRIRGRRVPSFGDDFVVIRTSRFKTAAKAKSSEEARFLVKKAGKALKHPGISKKAVFRRGLTGVFAYSVDPANPKKLMRRSQDGKRTIGRFFEGRFKAG